MFFQPYIKLTPNFANSKTNKNVNSKRNFQLNVSIYIFFYRNKKKSTHQTGTKISNWRVPTFRFEFLSFDETKHITKNFGWYIEHTTKRHTTCSLDGTLDLEFFMMFRFGISLRRNARWCKYYPLIYVYRFEGVENMIWLYGSTVFEKLVCAFGYICIDFIHAFTCHVISSNKQEWVFFCTEIITRRVLWKYYSISDVQYKNPLGSFRQLIWSIS